MLLLGDEWAATERCGFRARSCAVLVIVLALLRRLGVALWLERNDDEVLRVNPLHLAVQADVLYLPVRTLGTYGRTGWGKLKRLASPVVLMLISMREPSRNWTVMW